MNACVITHRVDLSNFLMSKSDIIGTLRVFALALSCETVSPSYSSTKRFIFSLF